MSFIKENFNWLMFITIIVLLIIAKISMVLDNNDNNNRIIIIKEPFGLTDDNNSKLKKIDNQLAKLEFKMITMKDPINDNIKPPKEKKPYIVTSNHYYSPSEMNSIQ
jgi:hypothetical protein